MIKQVIYGHRLGRDHDNDPEHNDPEPHVSVYENDNDFTLTVIVTRHGGREGPITLTGEQWKNLCVLLTDDPGQILVKNWKKRLTDEHLRFKQQYPFWSA